jgi:hypothetical protein
LPGLASATPWLVAAATTWFVRRRSVVPGLASATAWLVFRRRIPSPTLRFVPRFVFGRSVHVVVFRTIA